MIGSIIQGVAGAFLNASQAAVNRKAAKEDYRSSHYEARLAEIRGSMLRQQAAMAQEQGDAMVVQLAMRGVDALASARGSISAGNVELGAGSAGAYERDFADVLGQDLAAQKHLTAIDVWAFEVEAEQEDFQANWTRDYAERAWQIAKANAVLGTFQGANSGYGAYSSAGGKTGPSEGGNSQSFSQSSGSSTASSGSGSTE